MSCNLLVLANIDTLRSVANEVPLHLLEEVLKKFQKVVTERRQQVLHCKRGKKIYDGRRKTLKAMMEEDGINPSALLGSLAKSNRSTNKGSLKRAKKFKDNPQTLKKNMLQCCVKNK
ncbi:hypothetical protein ACP6OV_002203 [Cronobacter muytjensii]